MEGDFKIGEWLVSPALNQISTNGTSARVEPKSMQVLVYLAEHPGVVGKDQLISAVWRDVFVSNDVLPGCISVLRKAFDDNARRPTVIETIHKSGYRLLLPVQSLDHNGNVQTNQLSPERWWHRIRTHRWAVAIGLVSATATLFVAFAWVPSRQHYDAVAVLPFVNEGRDSTSQYLSDGIAEQVVNDLSQLNNVRVMAWTTVSRYRQPQTDVRAVGHDLGVKAVLTGRFLQQGDRVVLNTELVDVRTGSQLWGERYERAATDMPGLQEQLSQDIATNLRVKLTGEEQHRIQRLGSSSPVAYELYLKGRFFWNKRTKRGLQQAIEYFHQAIRADPNYALPYAGLADCYNLLDDWGETAPRDSFPKAKAAAEKAVELDPLLAEAHTSLAQVRAAYEWDWSGAEQEFRLAIQLNPNYPTAHQWYALFLASMGRFKEAEQEIRRAQQLDPLSPIINMGVAEVYAWERQYEQAIEQYKKVIALDPSFFGAHGNLATVYADRHMDEQAASESEQKWNLYGDSNFARVIRNAFSHSGYSGILRTELNRLLQDHDKGRYTDPVAIASYYAELGDQANTLQWLEKGYQEHSSSMQFLAVSYSFDAVRSSAQFQYWLNVVGLPSVRLTARGAQN